MQANHSGSTTNRAPCSTAISISRRASFKLALTLGPDAICTPATRNIGAGASGAGVPSSTCAAMLRGRARPKPNPAAAGSAVFFLFIGLTSDGSFSPGLGLVVFPFFLGHGRSGPGSGYAVVEGEDLPERVFQCLLQHQGTQTHGWIHDRSSNCHALTHGRVDADVEQLRFVREVHVAGHLHARRGSIHLEILRVRDPLRDVDLG